MLPVFTAFLSPDDFGMVAILTILSFFLLSVFSLGLLSSIGLCYFEEGDLLRKEQTIWTSFFVLLISSALMLLLFSLFIKGIGKTIVNSYDYDYYLFLTAVSTFFSIISIPFSLRLQLEQKAGLYFWLTLASAISGVLINILFVVIFDRGLQGMIEGILIGKVIFFIIFLIPALKFSEVHMNYKLSKELVKLGIQTVPGFFCAHIILYGNTFFLGKYNSLAEAGLYTVGFNIGFALQLIISGFTSAWTPFYMSYINKQDGAGPLFGKIFTYYLFVIGLVSLLFYVFAKPLIILFATPEFFNAQKIIGLTATAQLFLGLYTVFNAPIMLAKQPLYSTFCLLTATAAFIGMMFVFIPGYGIVGACIALILGYIILDILLLGWGYFNKNQLHIKYERKKTVLFLLLYLVVIIFILWDKKVTLIPEILFSLTSFLLFVLVTYRLLDSSERKSLISFTRLFDLKNPLKSFRNERTD